jgi:predicted lipoprotein with Yx(FWY)xxD motif
MSAGDAVDLGSTSLGQIVVDGAGMTLYMFDKDTQGGDSTCYDQCASAWPPLLTKGTPTAGAGVDASALGTVKRTDGTVQVTYHGWPLYHWAQDTAAGDVKGEGVNNVWWVLGADGQPIHG